MLYLLALGMDSLIILEGLASLGMTLAKVVVKKNLGAVTGRVYIRCCLQSHGIGIYVARRVSFFCL